jgi:hypothetical protein
MMHENELVRRCGKLWQRPCYEHVNRNAESLNQIREYIMGDPMQWLDDPEHPQARTRDMSHGPEV